ncbi:efflux RND transporter periplasmic adaptor subunit [Nonomuraea soli]|uniref:Multidrug efflux pump subunit AcrA (Membrane-fusion protein) n=1 Tax=Nonomuraea soli TaxID=1032476 RepID=A0A7W0HQ00_9ACTN|nr:efflux RND transporter periplasmic adaptor subunit [Nonomuraea soli]MBA2891292.1 multidrug efflux pump subunit AcrA (membrane-fusion protein) [Nonomuraea soli]
MTIRRGIPPLAILLLLTACSAEEAPEVQVAEVKRAPVVEVVEAPATIGARATATLRSPAQGTVAKLYVRDGDTVEKGQLLVKISSPQAEEQLKQARKAAKAPPAPRIGAPGIRLAGFDTGAFDRQVAGHFAKARAAARKLDDAQARRQLLSAIDLAQAQHRAQSRALAKITADLNRTINGVLSQVTGGLSGLTSSMASLRTASMAQSKAAVRVASDTVKGLSIKAPFDGVVTLGSASGGGGSAPDLGGLLSQVPGAMQLPSSGNGPSTPVATGVPVSAGDAVVTVTDISELTLSADIDETDVLLVKEGTKATVELDAVPGAGYAAKVTGVGVTPMEASTGGVSYPVRLTLGAGTFDDGSQAPTPKPGMSAVARLTVREVADALSAPASAIVTSGRESVVWVVRDGTAERRVVKLGAQGEAVVEVLSGLRAGERIVVKGADAVRQGQRLS